MRISKLLLVAGLIALMIPATALADAVFTATGTGLSASATFTFSGTNLTVLLTNTESPTTKNYNAGQTISDLSFTLTGATITGLTSATGQTCTVASTGNTGCSTGSLDRWVDNTTFSGSSAHLLALGGGQPSELIVPTGTITQPNGSIGNFQPFVIGSGTFVFSLSGITGTPNISSSTFSFGTEPDTFVTGTCTSGNCTPPAVPEPASLALLGVGLCAVGLFSRRKLRR